jgi:hypothetical protein
MKQKERNKDAPKKPAAIRQKVRGKRCDIRKKLRGAAGCLLPLGLAVLIGCATGTPGNKAPQTSADGNETTIIAPTYVGVLPLGSNGVAMAGGVTFVISPGATLNIGPSVHDVNGTISQAADVGGNDTTSQWATPTLQAGLTGDKPIEEVAAVGKTALAASTAGATTVGALYEQAKKLLAGGTTNTAALAAAASVTNACADGACEEK